MYIHKDKGEENWPLPKLAEIIMISGDELIQTIIVQKCFRYLVFDYFLCIYGNSMEVDLVLGTIILEVFGFSLS